MIDRWGLDIGGEASSIGAWNEAWSQFLHFRGDPAATIADAVEGDESFAIGSVFDVVYSVTGGAPSGSPSITADLERVAARAMTPTDRAHAEALDHLAAGDITAAADRWGALGAAGDFVAYRFAHDLLLHIGAAERRLVWSERSLDAHADRTWKHFIDGMHSFTLNEVGRYDDAVAFGRDSLAADADDLWARHALAHVYEETADDDSMFELLRDTTDTWADQDMLANHVWWHLALRLLAVGEIGEVLAIFDDRLPSTTTPFRLCDLSSLLWRAELAGHDVGDRWEPLADTWDTITERHTCGFVDLHAAITYLRRPDHPGSARWFDGIAGEPQVDGELAEIFDDVAKPLVEAFRAREAGDSATFRATLDRLVDTTARIGGSNAQRALITLTREATPV